MQKYVEGGGTLVFGCWSGCRNRNHWCYDAAGKAFYESLTGGQVTDFTVVPTGETSVMRFANSAAPVEAPIFNEVLAVDSERTDILAYYASNYYSGKPAVTIHRKGLGRVIHFGSFFTAQNVTALLDALAVRDPMREWADIPAEIQVTIRSGNGEQSYFLLNFTNSIQTITFKESVFDRLGKQKLHGHTEIPGYGVLFVRRVE